jgi:hypothetical protein
MTVVGVALVGAIVASAALSSKGLPSPTDPIYLHDDSDDQRHASTHEGQWQKWERCLHTALPALFMTVAVMVSGMGAPGAPGALPRRIGFRPFVPVLGVLGGLLAGAGTLVLAQQLALV